MSDIFDHLTEAFEDEFSPDGRAQASGEYSFRPPYSKPATQSRVCTKCKHEFTTTVACKCPQCGGWTEFK